MNDIDFQECSTCFELLLSDVVCCRKCEHWIHIKCWRTGICPICRSEEGWRKLSRVEIKFQKKLIFECEGCKVKLNILEMSKHVKTCPEIDVECECGKLIKRGALQIHLMDLCSKKRIQCLFCKGFIIGDQFENHLKVCSLPKNQQCPKMMIQCEFCERSLPMDRLENHLQKCQKKKIQCHLCPSTQLFSRDKLEYHQTDHCPKKMIQCSLCKSPLPRDQLKKHFQVCSKVFKCHLCKSKTLFIGDQLKTHLKEQCPLLHEIPKLLCAYQNDCVEKKFGLTFSLKTPSEHTKHLGFHRFNGKRVFDNDKESYYTFTTDVTWIGDLLINQPLSLFFDGKVYELSIPKFVFEKIEETDEYSDVILQQKCQICHVKITKDEVINLSHKIIKRNYDILQKIANFHKLNIYTHANCWRNLSAGSKEKCLSKIEKELDPYEFLDFLPPLNLLKNRYSMSEKELPEEDLDSSDSSDSDSSDSDSSD